MRGHAVKMRVYRLGCFAGLGIGIFYGYKVGYVDGQSDGLQYVEFGDSFTMVRPLRRIFPRDGLMIALRRRPNPGSRWA